MMENQRHGFVDAEIDYRHARLMAEVAQCIAPHRGPRLRIHRVLTRRR
jgi:hypothetical protein